MKEMGLKAVYARPRTTIIDKTHNKYPYLLKDLIIDKPNQVWAIDITYIKMPIGFVYLASLIDVFSRFIVASKLSINMETGFCLEVLNQGLEANKPEIINTDFYNYQRPHQSLNYNTPHQIYSGENEGNKVIHYSKKLKKIVVVQALIF